MSVMVVVCLRSRGLTVRVPVGAARVLLACENLRNTVSRNWKDGTA